MLLRPLQRVRVLSSKKKYKPGSTGYFVSQSSLGNYNGWAAYVVFTRFGKKGKPRVEPALLNMRMVEYDTMKESDQKIMNIIGAYENIDPGQFSQYSAGRRASSDELGSTVLETIPRDYKDLRDLSDNEFTAYIVAFSMLIHQFAYSKNAKTLMNRIVINKNNFVSSGFDLVPIRAGSLGYYILAGIKYDEAKFRLHFELDSPRFSEAYKHQIDTPAKRYNILTKLHRAFAMEKAPFNSYMNRSNKVFENMVSRIHDTISYYRNNKKDLKDIEAAGPIRPAYHYNRGHAYKVNKNNQYSYR